MPGPTTSRCWGAGFGISRATAYRYLRRRHQRPHRPRPGFARSAAPARRTRLRPPRRPLENAATHHHKPTPDRRHRRRSAPSQPLRISIPARSSLRSPQ
uniref:Transposase n=1 Tax=Paractinoplanes deccanensis TaxID=113561 RepID=A0A3G5BRX2_9ACTN|nr:transposase [Actinoplanes deccanensis]